VPAWTRRLAPVAAVVLLGLGAYANSHRGDMVYDDLRQIRDNPAVRDPVGLLRGTARGSVPPNRVVGYLTFAANHRAGGLVVEGWHAVNLAVHLAAALLLLALVQALFRTPRLAGSALGTHAGTVAFAAAALFVTHPLQSQAVSYLVQRLTSLAAALYLAAAVAYLAWRRRQEDGAPRPATAWAWYSLSLCAAFLALRTKEIAFTLPLALLLVERLLHGPLALRRWLALAPFGLLAAVIPLTLVRIGGPAGQTIGDADRLSRVQTGVSRLDYLRTEIPVIASYLRLLLWPEGQTVDHPDVIHRSFLAPPVLLSGLLLLGLLALAAWLVWRTAPSSPRRLDPAARLVGLGILWFFLALAVESSLIPIADTMVEHRAYLPAAGFFLATSTGMALLLARGRTAFPARAFAAGSLALALALGFATLLRNRVWFTELSLWADAVRKTPGKMRPQLNLGTALVAAGRPLEALPHLREAARLAPDLAYARAQLGALLLSLGRPADAEPELREALRLAPSDPEALFNLAELLHRSGRREEARGLFARFVEVAPAATYARAVALARERLR